MKVQALLNAAFIKPMVLNDDGKGTHDPPAPTEGGNISVRRQPAGGGAAARREGALSCQQLCHKDDQFLVNSCSRVRGKKTKVFQK